MDSVNIPGPRARKTFPCPVTVAPTAFIRRKNKKKLTDNVVDKIIKLQAKQNDNAQRQIMFMKKIYGDRENENLKRKMSKLMYENLNLKKENHGMKKRFKSFGFCEHVIRLDPTMFLLCPQCVNQVRPGNCG